MERKVVRAKRARVEAPETAGVPQSALSLQGFLRELVSAYAASVRAERKDLRMIRTLGIQPLLHILTFLRPSEAIGNMPRVSRSMAVALPPSALIVPELRIKWDVELPWPHLSRFLLHTRRLTLERMYDAADALALHTLPKLVDLHLEHATSATTMYNALQSPSLERLRVNLYNTSKAGVSRALRESKASKLVHLHIDTEPWMLAADLLLDLPVQLESLHASIELTGDTWVQLLERCKRLHAIDLEIGSDMNLEQWTKPARRNWTRVELRIAGALWHSRGIEPDRYTPTAQARLWEWFANPHLVSMRLTQTNQRDLTSKHVFDATFWRTFLGRLSSTFESMQFDNHSVVQMDANDAKSTPMDGGLLLSLLLTHTPRVRQLFYGRETPSYYLRAMVTDEATLIRGMQNAQWTLLDGTFPHTHFEPPANSRDVALPNALVSFAEQGRLTALLATQYPWTRMQCEAIVMAGRDWEGVSLAESPDSTPWDAPLSDAMFAHLATMPRFEYLWIAGACRPSKASLLALVPGETNKNRRVTLHVAASELRRGLDDAPSLGTTVDVEVLRAFYERPRTQSAVNRDALEHGILRDLSMVDDLVSWLTTLDAAAPDVWHRHARVLVTCLVSQAVASALVERLHGMANRWYHLAPVSSCMQLSFRREWE